MWKGKIEKEINEIRGEVAILDELLRGVKVKSRKPDKMKKKYAMKKWENLAPFVETLNQKIQLKAQRFVGTKKELNFTDKIAPSSLTKISSTGN